MICKGYNEHIIGLLARQQILWKCTLDDGTEVLSDFDVPDKKDPWTRLRQYCYNNSKKITTVSVIIPGNPEQEVYSNPTGLDNILIIRGISKDINEVEETTYSFMTFGQLKEDNLIYVTRFYWPECRFGTPSEIRQLTPENEELLYRQRKTCGDDCSCQTKKRRHP
jgi:hypothetical protein